MLSIEKYFVPSNTLLQTYLQNGAYGDCYWTDISRGVSFPEFILAFYTTPLFKIERSILPWTVSKPSTDNQARQLSTGASEIFAAWHVENRSENEILMCDFHGRTRSWLKVAPVDDARTRLYFGSAVIPSRNPRTGARSPDLYFKYYWDFIKSTRCCFYILHDQILTVEFREPIYQQCQTRSVSMTGNFLEKLFEHNNWANMQIIQACAALSEEQLDAEPQSVTKGTIRRTLLHLVHSQQGYLLLLTMPVDKRLNVAPTFAEFLESARASGEGLLALARGDQKPFGARLTTTDGFYTEPWVVMLQVINHATEHREQINSMMSALGVTPPDLDGWSYGEAANALIPIAK